METAQSLRFNKEQFPNIEDVRDWLRRSSFDVLKEPEEGANEWKVRLENPERFSTFRRKEIMKRVSLIVGLK